MSRQLGWSPTHVVDPRGRFALWTDYDLCTSFLAVQVASLLDALVAADAMDVVRLQRDQPVLPQYARPELQAGGT